MQLFALLTRNKSSSGLWKSDTISVDLFTENIPSTNALALWSVRFFDVWTNCNVITIQSFITILIMDKRYIYKIIILIETITLNLSLVYPLPSKLGRRLLNLSPISFSSRSPVGTRRAFWFSSTLNDQPLSKSKSSLHMKP